MAIYLWHIQPLPISCVTNAAPTWREDVKGRRGTTNWRSTSQLKGDGPGGLQQVAHLWADHSPMHITSLSFTGYITTV
jgi:hypothetical protein